MQRLIYDAKAIFVIFLGAIHDGVVQLASMGGEGVSGVASALGAALLAPILFTQRLFNATICVVK